MFFESQRAQSQRKERIGALDTHVANVALSAVSLTVHQRELTEALHFLLFYSQQSIS